MGSDKKEKNHKSETLTKLQAQKIQALQNGHTKEAMLIQRVIDRIQKKQ
jgi:hypothetical protein